MTSRDYFKGKRIAVMGLGAQSEMIADVKFLIKAGALVSVYDVKSEARLKTHLLFLRSIGLANYVCGNIPPDDLLDMDLILLSHEFPRDSSCLKAVYEHNTRFDAKEGEDKETVRKIPVEYPETLFFRLAPPVTLIGVIGMSGKSTLISILGPMLEKVCKQYESQQLFYLDPESEDGILAHLKKVKSSDIVLMRVVDLILPELHAMRISPHVAIFTSIPTKTSYTSTPFEILAFQTYNNFIIASDEIIDAMRSLSFQTRAKMLRTKETFVPLDWGFQGRGIHDRLNASLALQAAKLFKVDDDMARESLNTWKSLKGRLEFVKKVRNVEYFNDSMSMSPDATLAGVASLAENRNVILIFGGADSKHEYRILYSEIPKYIHTLVSIPGSGTMKQRVMLQELEGLKMHASPSIEEAVRKASEFAQKGDRVLFSPGFEAGGVEGSKKERGEKFVRAVRAL
ncbi:MAG: hypothetical protein M3Q80_02550 [bacterium]|nr:hypothetical protein [bacterium]